ncbi:chemotaxis protein CheA [Sulfurospirillum barnesii]|uniref:Chemotaxis protein CheA n=1 Tax=Sulfurospirillum barnesii (strain ATCC 700032 / DSM 10660 / SES-3) TaxID=760154 RepID=I3XZK9_SULBS|nr:chemotaxis protein CheA [Sulfurospirillum barnesii]AFL69383.1 chemotaxis protein histidine kinase-like protein [Sulfurospirillum barnesii SES-3]
MSREKLRQIFIEEANEIIEKMDVDIINYEESPNNKELLNEIFRGVHTLKGSANAFNFSRLGEFVHHFEDVLDFFRNADAIPTGDNVDLFLESVNVIKETLVCETQESAALPEAYGICLQHIQTLLLHLREPLVVEHASTNDVTLEFDNDHFNLQHTPNEALFLSQLQEGESLFRITLKLDSDIYLRGFDHFLFFTNLLHVSKILASYWQVPEGVEDENFDVESNVIQEVLVYVSSTYPKENIEDIFAFLDEEEFRVDAILPPSSSVVDAPQMIAEHVLLPKEEEGLKTETQQVKNSVLSKNFLKIDAQKLDELFDSIGELVIAQNCLGENSKIKAIQDAEVSKTIENLSKITRLIQNRVMSLRMVPIRDTFEKMKRVVRDSSKKVNKPIHLILEGEETEIDKTMVEALSDPLVHIIRNAIDHGIESTPEARIAMGKSEEGNVSLRAYHRGGNIIIEVRDDGRGINKAKVYEKALERGIIEKDESLSDAQIYGLIMQAGFSTADSISDISGRGVGLDVVRSAIEAVRGKVDISSQEGVGTTFSIVLPLTLAIIDGMLVRSNDKVFIIPTLSITESFRPLEQSVHSAGGKEEFVQLRSELLPIIRLNRVLALDETAPHPWECTLVCIENGRGKFALLVDELVGRQQVVIKTLGGFLAKTEGISGGAVMGNGEIALILNVEELY